jgi:3-dehydroquinate dehydratase-1
MQQALSVLSLSGPATVGVISDAQVLHATVEKPDDQASLCNVFEIRADLIGLPTADLLANMARLTLPKLLTLRHPAEGGKGPTDAAERAAALRPLLAQAQLLDIEIQFAPDLLDLIREAQGRGIKVVGSWHDFQATPDLAVLQAAADQAKALGLDAAKFACYLQSPGDLQVLMSLVTDSARSPLSVMGMGPLGRVSRLVLSRLGSVLNYGYLGEANAPGQWPARQLKQLIADL